MYWLFASLYNHNTMQLSPLISVIIVTWNSSRYLPACLDALLAQTEKDFEVVVIDNGSADPGYLDLEEKYADLHLTLKKNDQNLGFAVANNFGAGLARGKWLALLNADAFPEVDWLAGLLEAVEIHPNAFFASRQIQAKDPGSLDGEGDVLHVSGLAWRHNYNSPVYPLRESQEVFSACGAAVFYPRRAFLDAGGFDEDYFAYHEDVDLGFRLRLRGLSCWLVPGAVVHHVGSASTGKNSAFSVYYGHRNLVWTYFKDMPAGLFWLCLPLHLAVNFFFLIYFTLKGQGRVIARAKWDALRGLPAVLKKRGAIQRDRRVSAAGLHRVMSRNWLSPFLAFVKRKRE